MLRAARTLGNHFPQSIGRPRIGSGIYPRFILHNEIFSDCNDERGANTPIAAVIAGEGLWSISLSALQTTKSNSPARDVNTYTLSSPTCQYAFEQKRVPPPFSRFLREGGDFDPPGDLSSAKPLIPPVQLRNSAIELIPSHLGQKPLRACNRSGNLLSDFFSRRRPAAAA